MKIVGAYENQVQRPWCVSMAVERLRISRGDYSWRWFAKDGRALKIEDRVELTMLLTKKTQEREANEKKTCSKRRKDGTSGTHWI